MANTPSCLVPGYKQVDAFGPDSDYEEGEEVAYVTLDVGPIEPTLVPSSSTYRLIGLDTPTPFLQLSGTVLKGRHDSLLGTELIFSESKDGSSRGMQFVGATEQRIQFKEVTLKPKVLDDPTGEATASANKANDSHVRAFLRDDDELLGRVTGTIVGRTTADGADEDNGMGKAKGKARGTGRGRGRGGRSRGKGHSRKTSVPSDASSDADEDPEDPMAVD